MPAETASAAGVLAGSPKSKRKGSVIEGVPGDPSFHKNQPCLICGHTGHSFADCPSMTANTPKTFETFGKLVSLLDRGCCMAQACGKQIGSTHNPMQSPQFPPPTAVPTQAHSSAPVPNPSIHSVDALRSLTKPLKIISFAVNSAFE